MDAARKEGLFSTIKDIYDLPDGQRAELMDGQMYMMAPPSTKHQAIVMDLSYQISDYIRKKKGGCRIFPAPFAVFLNGNNKTYVEPDISVICDQSKLDENGCHGAPDWIIEVVSPSSKQMDYYKKLFKYRTAGVKEYWAADPERQIITVYDFQRDSMEEYPFGKEVPVGIYEGFSIKL